MRFHRSIGLFIGAALGVVMAQGCSSATTGTVDSDSDGAPPNAVGNDGSTTPLDGGNGAGDAAVDVGLTDAATLPRRDGGPDGGLCPGAAPTVADLDADGGWKAPPAKAIGACSPANITTFQGNFSTAQSYNDLKAGLPATCVSCIFSVETAATWKFVVTDATGDLGFFNYGACYARATYGSNACGKAIQYNEFCIDNSCADCSSSSATSACKSDSQTESQCAANFASGVQAGCGTNTANLQALDASCGSATKAVNILCGTGS
jgi:hypothetical protein